jgi:hypothetical protein
MCEGTPAAIERVVIEAPEIFFAKEFKALNLDPVALRMSRRAHDFAVRRFKHVLEGTKLVDQVKHICAAITPSHLSLINFYPDGEPIDQRFNCIVFRQCAFEDYPKTGEGRGIFNDAVLYRAQFFHCKFSSVDFSGIDPELFQTICFGHCEFLGETKLPEGYQLENHTPKHEREN